MTEESQDKTRISNKGPNILKLVFGLILVVSGIWALIGWWSSLVVIFKGFIGVCLILVGLVIIAIAKE